jgi:type I restriction enzyme S subunit
MRKYGEYRDSGVGWIGDVPNNWSIIRMKYVFNEINNRSVDGKGDLLSVSQYTGVTRRSEGMSDGDNLTNAATLEGYKEVRKGDLVTNIMLAWNGSLGFSPLDGITSPAYSIYRLQGNNSERFFHYLLRTDKYKSEFKRNSTGVVESRLRLYSDDFFAMETLLPPFPEQTAIATFLDQKTAQIDRAIAQKERLIELLRERKQIVIQQAVTRGLDPTVAMKDSGVEWIGEVPGHWEVKPLKHIGFMQSGETIKPESFTEEGYNVYGGNGFRGYTSTFTNEGPHILIGRQGALCGNVNYADGKFYASEHAVVFYPWRSPDLTWLGEAIRLSNLGRTSQSTAQPGISVGVIKEVKFVEPPESEQKLIGRFIDKVSILINQSVILQTQQIAKLKEYRTVLIDASVTGKIKVE